MLSGDNFLRLIGGAKREVILVAPYIKAGALRRVINLLSARDIPVTCVTRWLPEDVAAGVCDLEIWDILEEWDNSALYVHAHLHAKYYRVDERYLVGSANLTARGLGWTIPSNLELLIDVSKHSGSLRKWEERLLELAVPATKAMRNGIEEEAQRLTQMGAATTVVCEVEKEAVTGPALNSWVPTCPAPERLWDVYTGHAETTMVTGALEAARADLAVLSPPGTLDHRDFNRYVRANLMTMPILSEIDQCADTDGLSDTGAHRILRERLGLEEERAVEQAWGIIKAWLLCFFPDQYRTRVISETLIKSKRLDSTR